MMKNVLMLMTLMLLPFPFYGQKLVAKKDVSNWTLFSDSYKRPQYKPTGDGRFIAYYRTSLNDSGIMLLDSNLNVQKNISLKLTKNRVIQFSSKDYINLVSYPLMLYKQDDNSVILVGNVKNSRKGYSVIALTYSLDSEELIKTDTLRHLKGENVITIRSNNDKYFLVGEPAQDYRDSKDTSRMKFDVFTPDCKRLYSAKLAYSKKGESNLYLTNKGELIHCYMDEVDREDCYKFSKYNSAGVLEGSTYLIPLKDERTEYEFSQFIESSKNELFCVCTNAGKKLKKLIVLSFDFSKGTCKRIVDKTYEKEALVKMYEAADIKYSVVNSSKIKTVKKLKYFIVNASLVDDNGFYIVLEHLVYSSKSQGSFSYYTLLSKDIIVNGFDKNGVERWITPIKKKAKGILGWGDYYTGGKASVCAKADLQGRYISLVIPSLENVFITWLNTKTGENAVPIKLFTEDKTYTNTNSLLWLDPSHLIVTPMKGVFSGMSKKHVELHLLKFPHL